MRIFLTGGTGLVGSLLINKLRERGGHVVALSRRPDILCLAAEAFAKRTK